jgi:hypothetical protein
MGNPHRSPLSALQLFRLGRDTATIANILRISEAQALEQLSRERSAALGRPDPYSTNLVPVVREVPLSRSGRVAYAGRE